jgi:hypothetical protein
MPFAPVLVEGKAAALETRLMAYDIEPVRQETAWTSGA